MVDVTKSRQAILNDDRSIELKRLPWLNKCLTRKLSGHNILKPLKMLSLYSNKCSTSYSPNLLLDFDQKNKQKSHIKSCEITLFL